MSRNHVLSIIALTILAIVLVKGLAFAFLGMRVLNFVFIVLAFVGVGWLWGKFSK